MLYKELEEKWLNAKFTDAFVFVSVLTEHKDITKELIELFNPELHIKNIEFITNEKLIQHSTINKYVRLDILAKLEDDTLVNIEMQLRNEGNLPKRIHYYASSLTVSSLNVGEDYSNLPEVIVMVLCDFDLFSLNKPIYEFKYKTDDNTYLNDGSKVIVINDKGNLTNLTKTQRAFLQYLKSYSSTDNLTTRINEAVNKLKYNKDKRENFMRLEYELNKRYREGKEEGIQEGISEGIAKGTIEERKTGIRNTFKILKSLNLSDEEAISKIKETYDISIEEINDILCG